MNTQKPTVANRLGAMLVDHIIMTIIGFVIFLPMMTGIFSDLLSGEFDFDMIGEKFLSMGYVMALTSAIYICKDTFNGRSIGKRSSRLQVVNNSDGKPASPLRCMVRNLFIAIWPVEVFITLFSPDRRLGDLIAGTRVTDYDPESEKAPFNFLKAGMAFTAAYAIYLFTLVLPLEFVFQTVKSEYGKYGVFTSGFSTSDNLEQRFQDEFGTAVDAEVNIQVQYLNGVQNNQVEVMLYLQENLLADPSQIQALDSVAANILFSEFDHETFVGKINYIYDQEGNRATHSSIFDWREKPSEEDNE